MFIVRFIFGAFGKDLYLLQKVIAAAVESANKNGLFGESIN